MKAWVVKDKDGECGSEIIYAETRGKAIAYALSACDNFEYLEWVDLRARRFKEFDKYYEGDKHPEFWLDDKFRLILVRDHGWFCCECWDGKKCPAYPYCSEYRAEYGKENGNE